MSFLKFFRPIRHVTSKAVLKAVLIAMGFLTSILSWGALTSLGVMIHGSMWHYGVPQTYPLEFRPVFAGFVAVWVIFCIIPFLWLGLAFLKRPHFLRIGWFLVLACFHQLFFTSVCEFLEARLMSHRERPLDIEVWPTFEQVRAGFSPIERVVYTPVLYLVEHGYGTLALIVHSLVWGAIVTGILYALVRIYRMWRRPPAVGESGADAATDAGSAANRA